MPRDTDGNHDVQVFDTLLEGEFIDETRLAPPRVKKPVPFYKGQVELQVRNTDIGREGGFVSCGSAS